MQSLSEVSVNFGRALFTAGALAFFLGTGWAYALQTGEAPIEGQAIVVDGDTLEVAGQRLRLQGIDAPEMAQTCKRAGGEDWACGIEAQQALVALIGGKPVACDRKGLDKYGRVLAICFAGEEDINGWMVENGYAWAFVRYSGEYVAAEASARDNRAGIWQAQNVPAWDFRHSSWQTAINTAPGGCAIKGNISKKGQIYHVPWSTWYEKVKIDASRGERWFCSEAEALAAGWRPAGQR